MHERKPEQLQAILPDDWVPAAEIPRKKPAPRSLVRINRTCISLPEITYRRMGCPGGVTFFFHGNDVILIPARDYVVEDRGTGLYLVHLRRLAPFFNLGQYNAERDAQHFTGLKAVRLKGASALHSTEIRHEKNPRTERRLASAT